MPITKSLVILNLKIQLFQIRRIKPLTTKPTPPLPPRKHSPPNPRLCIPHQKLIRRQRNPRHPHPQLATHRMSTRQDMREFRLFWQERRRRLQ